MRLRSIFSIVTFHRPIFFLTTFPFSLFSFSSLYSPSPFLFPSFPPSFFVPFPSLSLPPPYLFPSSFRSHPLSFPYSVGTRPWALAAADIIHPWTPQQESERQRSCGRSSQGPSYRFRWHGIRPGRGLVLFGRHRFECFEKGDTYNMLYVAVCIFQFWSCFWNEKGAAVLTLVIPFVRTAVKKASVLNNDELVLHK